MSGSADSNRTVKIMLSQSEQDLIRLAAAVKRKSMSEYCRDLVVANANEVVNALDPTMFTTSASHPEKPRRE